MGVVAVEEVFLDLGEPLGVEEVLDDVPVGLGRVSLELVAIGAESGSAQEMGDIRECGLSGRLNGGHGSALVG